MDVRTLLVDFVRTVAAGRAAGVTQAYTSSEYNLLVGPVAASAASEPPGHITVDRPSSTVDQRSLVLSGHVSAGPNGLPTTISSAAATVPVAADGSFRIPAPPLDPGANVVSLAAVDAGGERIVAQVDLQYVNPGAIGRVTGAVAHTVVTRRVHGRVVSRQRVVSALQIRVGLHCAPVGATCLVQLNAYDTRHRLGSSRVTLAPGSTRTVVVTLSAATLRKYLQLQAFESHVPPRSRHAVHLFFILQVDFLDTDGHSSNFAYGLTYVRI